ncbi:MAG: 16S rRNA (cytosine(967)-C(5))-methyltransferase RsmB [Acidaminococcales bacterium]|jgi:16S rRNA (cytosine967-C5)-methyltransferase|nr:16S rRNA (cytosine(967)-C(5))-methyltransferase RsmB [Acidaminococcales bacterium]
MGKPPEHLSPSRLIALRTVSGVWKDGAYANIALNRELNKSRLPEIERRFVTEMVYGAVRAGLVLDRLLARFTVRPPAKIPAVILYILRLGLYQMFFLDKIPVAAVCNEAVKQARKFGHEGTAKFVNGILRAAARWKDSAGLEAEPELAEALVRRHPDWLFAHWTRQIGEEGARAICLINNLPAPVCLRVNTLKTNAAALGEILRAEGVDTTPSLWCPEGLVAERVPPLAALDSFRRGLYQAQDESSMLVAPYLNVRPGQTVLDLCAAPGGKTVHIAQLMQNKGEIIASDIYEHKLALINENAQRMGIAIIKTVRRDASAVNPEWFLAADRVLVDAPCSGLGVLRRRPDLRWRRQETDLKKFPPLQAAILRTAARYVRPGGKLLYSTCTTEPAENFALVKNFLAENDCFEPVKIRHPREPATLDCLQLWPHIDKTDGFFICVLRRK